MGYLVLSRRPGERIKVGKDVYVTLVGLQKGQAKIAIEAPDNMAIDREEIAIRKEKERGGNYDGD